MDLFTNPELIRNARAQLRVGRMLAVAGICAAVSLTMAYAFWESDRSGEWAMNLLATALGTQVFVLSIGGSFACLQSVSREKELNTFDYQRVTRLTPLELALGKLLGAPVLAYFVTLCFMPLTLVAAVLGGVRPSFLAAALIVLVAGSITLHAASLMISMLLARGLSVGGAVILLYFLGVGSIPDFGEVALGRLSPFFALDLVQLTSWAETTRGAARLRDSFFGVSVHHFWALLFLYGAFTAWFLLSLSRNLKRDPSTYELYSPRQSFAFAMFINLLFVGFYRWEGKPPLESQSVVLTLNSVLFFGLGLALVLNRDQVRRRVRTLGESATNWMHASWPAPYLVAGISAVGILASLLYSRGAQSASGMEWNWPLAMFRIAFLAAWISRDVLFLQWLNITRIKRPLVMGFVYLMVYYVCMMILLAVTSPGPGTEWIAATFIPAGGVFLSLRSWTSYANGWVVSLVLQAAICGVFVFLQQRKLQEIAAPALPASAAAD